MRVLLWTCAAAVAVAAAPQSALAQNRDRGDRIRDVRRTQQETTQRQQALERRSSVLDRARRDSYQRERRRNDDRSIADILRERRDRRERAQDEDWRHRRDDDWRGRDRDDDWRADGARGNGPPFCRNGQGHPVHGRQWCRDRGWTSDYDRYGRYDRRDDVLRRAPLPRRERDRRLDVVGRARGLVGSIH